MRVAAGLVTLSLLSLAIALNAGSQVKPPAEDQGATTLRAVPAPRSPYWIKLTFGLDGAAEPWDGSVAIENGRIFQSLPWSFEKRDRFDPVAHKWFCTTVVLPGRSASSYAEPQRGVLLEIEPAGDTTLAVATKQGKFTVATAELTAGRPALFLDNRASAELLGTSARLPESHTGDVATEDDYPSFAIDAQGNRWVAWIGYDDAAKRDHLRVLNLDNPQGAVEEIPTAREQLDPRLLLDAENRLWLFWSAPIDGNWELWASKRGDNGWNAAQRITMAEGTDFHLAAARGPQGEIWLAWQAFRGNNSDILVKRLQKGKWSQEFVVAESAANEWEPDISIDPSGTAWIGYDSYENGNYDVLLTSISVDDDGQAAQGKTLDIAVSEDFEAHAAVDASDGKHVWVAYDAAGPNWGKDFTRDVTEFKGRYGETLHASRRLQLRAVVDGQLMMPAVSLPQNLNKIHPEKIRHSDSDEYKRFYELPHLLHDGDGRLWVFFRLNRQGYAGHPTMGANWEFYATTFVGGTWLEPILLPPSIGRQNQQVSTALDQQGQIHVAWSTGHHFQDITQQVRVGKLPPVRETGIDLPLIPNRPAKAKPTPEPLVRSWKMQARGETYRVYFGDLHRHTDISHCYPTADGCLVDAYRYALDASRLDFLAVTDHTRDTDPYPWWRTQKANDLFTVKDTFAPIYAYERSNGTVGGGHRNVFFLERDWPVLRGDAHYSHIGQKPTESTNPDVSLYPKLRGKNALTAAHTPAYSAQAMRGTWTYNDPQVEPIAEIIQTFRRDYERPGPPQWPDARDRSNVAEEASLWYALARGYRLGFIASSDHHATHTSYACVWAKGPSRAEIFDGLRSRRTYAATDKILLDVRMGDALLGEEIDAPQVPELAIHVRGTDKIVELQVVRDRTVISSTAPNEREVETIFRDTEYPGGAAYYYVRVRQADNNMAWGSPIWVK
jgi:hypothetical protein